MIKFKTGAIAFGTLLAAAAAPVLAQAPTPTGSSTCDLTTVTFGSPSNSADKSQVQCTVIGGVQIALTATPRFNGLNQNPPPVVETFLGSGLYLASTGAGNPTAAGLAQWNFGYAITGNIPAGEIFRLFIDRDAGFGTSYTSFLLNAADNPNTGLSYQNSENEGFFNLLNGPTDIFDPNANGMYTFQVREYTAADEFVGYGSINVQTGTGPAATATPEPASMVLLATGLAGLVGVNRRRNKRNV